MKLDDINKAKHLAYKLERVNTALGRPQYDDSDSEMHVRVKPPGVPARRGGHEFETVRIGLSPARVTQILRDERAALVADLRALGVEVQ